MFSWRAQTGPVHVGLHRPRGRRAAPAPSPRSTSAGTWATTPPPSRRTGARSRAPLGCSAIDSLFMQQCHGSDVVVADGPWGAAGAAAGRRGGHRHRRGWPSPCWSPTARRCCWPTRRPASSGAVHAGRPGHDGRHRRRRRRGRCATSGPATCSAVVGPVGLRPVLRGAGGDAGRRGRRWRPSPSTGLVVRHPGDRCGGRSRRPAARRNDVAVQWVPGCAREDEQYFSYRRDGRTGRFAGVVVAGRRREPRTRPRARRAELAAQPRAASGTGSRRPAPSPDATPPRCALVAVTKFFPATDVELLAELGVHDDRREPRPGGRRPRWPS